MKTKYKQSHSHHSLELEPKITAAKSKTIIAHEERSKSAESQKGRKSFSDRPSPLDFDAFLPWVCLEWQCLKTVTVTKIVVQETNKKKDKRVSSTRSRCSKILKVEETAADAHTSRESVAVDNIESEAKPNDKNNVDVKSVYDAKGHLVEVAIIGVRDIPRKVIKAIALCLPFHALFTKLTIRQGGVTSPILLEIGALLRPSNITEVYLENCFVPQGNFYVLLEQISQLKNLCLNRCHINDNVCDKLVSRIEFGAPGSSLLILDLGSNCITDVGAKRIGQVLKLNRTLLHLNLSDNKITDVGAAALLLPLAEFPLNADEIMDKRQRKLEYARNKVTVYKNCFEEVLKMQQRREMESSSGKKSLTKFKSIKKEKSIKKTSPEFSETAAETAERMTKEIIGDFFDPFDSKGLKMKDGVCYGVGNLILCSLNLAYNKISFATVKKIYEVLKYQLQIVKEKPQTGLMRVVFDGNYVPVNCIEYQKIEELLNNVIYTNTPVITKSQILSIRRGKTSPNP